MISNIAFLDNFREKKVLDDFYKFVSPFVSSSEAILHFCTGNLFGGIEKILVNLSKIKINDSKFLHEHGFVLMYPGRLSQELSGNGVNPFFVGSARRRYPWQVWAVRRRFKSLLGEVKRGVVIFHSTWTYSLFAKTARKCGFRVGLWMHDLAKPDGWEDRVCRAIEPELLIANSLFTSKTAHFLYPNKECHVVYPFISEISKLKVNKKNLIRRQFRERIGTPEGKPVILVAARFDPYKGHCVLFDSLDLIKDLDWECWVAGEPVIDSELAVSGQLSNKALAFGYSERVKWLGHLSDTDELFLSADIYCQPNVGPEPFGMVFVEAQQAGCPVVTTGMGGALETVEENGRNILLEKSCPRILASRLREMLAVTGGPVPR